MYGWESSSEIVLTNGLGGVQVGLWFSYGQLRDQLADDDAIRAVSQRGQYQQSNSVR
ncbi:MAG: hypothetical protein QOD36_1386 [Mycobacterium sp.]|jgi:hypothetical protein|nr:hypothetical protein [Mycobacterium sp.]